LYILGTSVLLAILHGHLSIFHRFLVPSWCTYCILCPGKATFPQVKGTQAWDNSDFFLPKKNQNLICPWSIKKNFNSFPSIFARILMFEHLCGDWAYAEPNVFGEPSKICFPKIFTLVLLDGFLDGFLKFWLLIALHFNLGFLSNSRKL
jgi:hypothetical protein